MSIATLAAYTQNITYPRQTATFQKASLTTVAGLVYSTWTIAGMPAAGSAPTTAVVPDRTTTGALGQNNSSGTQRLLRSMFSVSGAGTGHAIICDRLSHQGGLDATVTSAQTTNLPTAALTRQTGGVGVQIGLEVYTTIGNTATTVTCSYTNSAGAAAQTSIAQTFGGTNYRLVNRMIQIPIAAGDVGVKAVASVTVLATTATAGNFGVTLFKPVISIPLGFTANYATACDDDGVFNGGWMPTIDDGACLFALIMSSSATAGSLQGNLMISED